MKFKKNITVTLACVITECLFSIIPVILMIYLFFFIDKFNEIFSTLLIVPYFIVIINIILIIISLIGSIFIKTKYILNENVLVIVTPKKSWEINYADIANITYDFGDLTRFNAKPSQLILFDKEFKQLLIVDNPSIIMVSILRKKCKNVKVNYYHNKRFLYLLSLINGIVLLICIFAKIFL